MRRIMMIISVLFGSTLLASPALAGAPAHLLVTVGGTPVADGATSATDATTVGAGLSFAVNISDQAGAGDLVVTALTLTSPGGIGWHIDPVITQPTLPTTNPGGSGYSVYPRCLAETVGDFTGTLVISSNDPTNPTFTIHLRCHVDAAVSVSPPSLVVTYLAVVTVPNHSTLPFGAQVPVGESRDITVGLGNGFISEPLHVESVSLVGDPEITLVGASDTLPATVEAEASVTLVLRCSQTSLKVAFATLTVVSDDPDDNPFVVRFQCSSFNLPDESETPDPVVLPDTGSSSPSLAVSAAASLALGLGLRRLSRGARRLSVR